MASMDRLLRTFNVINSSLLQLRLQQETSKASAIIIILLSTHMVYCITEH